VAVRQALVMMGGKACSGQARAEMSVIAGTCRWTLAVQTSHPWRSNHLARSAPVAGASGMRRCGVRLMVPQGQYSTFGQLRKDT
jgi:hypothetical protein